MFAGTFSLLRPKTACCLCPSCPLSCSAVAGYLGQCARKCTVHLLLAKKHTGERLPWIAKSKISVLTACSTYHISAVFSYYLYTYCVVSIVADALLDDLNCWSRNAMRTKGSASVAWLRGITAFTDIEKGTLRRRQYSHVPFLAGGVISSQSHSSCTQLSQGQVYSSVIKLQSRHKARHERQPRATGWLRKSTSSPNGSGMRPSGNTKPSSPSSSSSLGSDMRRLRLYGCQLSEQLLI